MKRSINSAVKDAFKIFKDFVVNVKVMRRGAGSYDVEADKYIATDEVLYDGDGLIFKSSNKPEEDIGERYEVYIPKRIEVDTRCIVQAMGSTFMVAAIYPGADDSIDINFTQLEATKA